MLLLYIIKATKLSYRLGLSILYDEFSKRSNYVCNIIIPWALISNFNIFWFIIDKRIDYFEYKFISLRL